MRLKDKVSFLLPVPPPVRIGEGMVRLFAREGARVMIHGTRKEIAATLSAELGQEKGASQLRPGFS